MNLSTIILIIAATFLIFSGVLAIIVTQEKEWIYREYNGELASIQYDRWGFGNECNTHLRFTDGFSIMLKGEYVFQIGAKMKITYKILRGDTSFTRYNITWEILE